MARYNTTLPSTTASSAVTLGTPSSGFFTEITGSGGIIVTIPDPTQYAGSSQVFYNASSGNVTLSSSNSGNVFKGPGSSGTNNQVLPTLTNMVIYSDGTSWITFGNSGGALTATSGTFSGSISGVTSLSMGGALSGVTTLGASGTVTLSQSTGNNLLVQSSTDATNATSGSIQTTGGIGVAKSISLGSSGNAGKVIFQGSTSGTVTFQAAATAGSASYTWPTADAAGSGYALTSNGSGTLSWSQVGASIATSASSSSFYPVFVSSTSGTVTTLNVASSGFAFVPSTGTLTVTAFVESSSIALKENISPINNALDLILKLTGVTYDRKDGTGKNEAGLIAEHVNKILPNLVSKDAKGKPTGIHYTKLTAYLIEAVKMLQSEIDELKKSTTVKNTKGSK
jgi:hypothetical protein